MTPLAAALHRARTTMRYYHEELPHVPAEECQVSYQEDDSMTYADLELLIRVAEASLLRFPMLDCVGVVGDTGKTEVGE